MNYSAIKAVRGRPREFDPDQALAAALRVFWEHGYKSASMAQLTEAMGITKPSLYACFGNKEELFQKALDLYEREKLAYVKAALNESTAFAIVRSLLGSALAAHCGGKDPSGCLSLIAAVTGKSEANPARDKACIRRAFFEAALTERFAQAKAKRDLPDGSNPKALATCVAAFLSGLTIKVQDGTTRPELEAAVDTFLNMWPSR